MLRFFSPHQFVCRTTTPGSTPEAGGGVSVPALPSTEAEYRALAVTYTTEQKKQIVEAYVTANDAVLTPTFKASLQKAIALPGAEGVDLAFQFLFHPGGYRPAGGASVLEQEATFRDTVAVLTEQLKKTTDAAHNPPDGLIRDVAGFIDVGALLPVDTKLASQEALNQMEQQHTVYNQAREAVNQAAQIFEPNVGSKLTQIYQLPPPNNMTPGSTELAEYHQNIRRILGVEPNQPQLISFLNQVDSCVREYKKFMVSCHAFAAELENLKTDQQVKSQLYKRLQEKSGLAISNKTQAFTYVDAEGTTKTVTIKAQYVKPQIPTEDRNPTNGLERNPSTNPGHLVITAQFGTQNAVEMNVAHFLSKFANNTSFRQPLLENITDQPTLEQALGLTNYGQKLTEGLTLDYKGELQRPVDFGNGVIVNNSLTTEITGIDNAAKEITLTKAVKFPGLATPKNVLSFAEFARFWRANHCEVSVSTDDANTLLKTIFSKHYDANFIETQKENKINASSVLLNKHVLFQDKFDSKYEILETGNGRVMYRKLDNLGNPLFTESLTNAQFIKLAKEDEFWRYLPAPDENTTTQNKPDEAAENAAEKADLRSQAEKEKQTYELARARFAQSSRKNFFEDIIDRIEFTSLNDLSEIFKLAGESIKESFTVKAKVRAMKRAKEVLPEKIGGTEAELKADAASGEYTKKFKDRFENISRTQDLWTIMEKLNGNIHETYALIAVLCDRGEMRFDDKRVWTALNRCTKKNNLPANLYIPDVFANEPDKARDYVLSWFEIIGGGKGVQLDQTNTSKFVSGAQELKTKAEKAGDTGTLIPRIDKLLNDWKEGKAEQNASKEFLMFLEYAIEQDELSPDQMMYYFRGAFTLHPKSNNTSILSRDLISPRFSKFAKIYFPFKHTLADIEPELSQAAVSAALTHKHEYPEHKDDTDAFFNQGIMQAMLAWHDLWHKKTIKMGRDGLKEASKDSIHAAISAIDSARMESLMGIGTQNMYSGQTLSSAEMLIPAAAGFPLVAASFALVPADPADRAEFDKSRSSLESSDKIMRLMVQNFLYYKAGTLNQAGRVKQSASFLEESAHGFTVGQHMQNMTDVIYNSLIAVKNYENLNALPITFDENDLKVVKHCSHVLSDSERTEETSRIVEGFDRKLNKLFKNKHLKNVFMRAFIEQAQQGKVNGIEYSTSNGPKAKKYTTGKVFADHLTRKSNLHIDTWGKTKGWKDPRDYFKATVSSAS